MKEITFEYRDEFSHGKWNRQSCQVVPLQEAIEIYGLGKDCEYSVYIFDQFDYN